MKSIINKRLKVVEIILGYQTAYKAQQEQIYEIMNELDPLKNQIKKLQKEGKEKDDKILALDKDLKEKEGTIEIIRKSNASLRKEIEVKTKEIDELQAQITAYIADHGRMTATIEQLNSEIEQYKTQIQYIDQVQNLLHEHLDITTNFIGKRKIDALHEEEEKEDLELNKLHFDVFDQSLKEAKKQAKAAKTTKKKKP